MIQDNIPSWHVNYQNILARSLTQHGKKKTLKLFRTLNTTIGDNLYQHCTKIIQILMKGVRLKPALWETDIINKWKPYTEYVVTLTTT